MPFKRLKLLMVDVEVEHGLQEDLEDEDDLSITTIVKLYV